MICVAVWEFIFPQSFVLWNLPPVSVFQTFVSLLSSIVLPFEPPTAAVTVFEETMVESLAEEEFTLVLVSELELLFVVEELLLEVSVLELLDELLLEVSVLELLDELLTEVSVLELPEALVLFVVLLPVAAVLLPAVLPVAVLEELALPAGLEPAAFTAFL